MSKELTEEMILGLLEKLPKHEIPPAIYVKKGSELERRFRAAGFKEIVATSPIELSPKPA